MKCNGLCQRVTAIGCGLALATMIGMGMESVESVPDCKPGTAQTIAPPPRVSTMPPAMGDTAGTISTTWDK